MKSRIFYTPVLLWLSLAALPVAAQEESREVVPTAQPEGHDSVAKPKRKTAFFSRLGRAVGSIVREFNNTDSTYIEPQHYNYAVMLQQTTTYEKYSLSDKSGQKVTFAPDMSFRMGPYAGWRWVFLGYTFDLSHISFSSSHTSKKEFDFSLYSSMIGVDLFWRQTGNDYKIESLDLGNGANTSGIKNTPFAGLKSSIRGFNLYYIFNHRKFSYPAAYSQSTVQRRSAGSAMAGIGYTRHRLDIDLGELQQVVVDKLRPTLGDVATIDTTLYSKVNYTDVSISGGYAYNWVFAKNFLFNASLSVGLAYNASSSDVSHKTNLIKDFNFSNFNFDGIGRFALVWNDTHWFAGMSAIIHSYNYKREQFSTNNSFGSFNIYVGFNFGRRRKNQ